MNDILVSIITVSYNSERTIEKTIRSVLEQTYRNYEYIIVDGASTDRTMDIIREYEPLFEGKMKIISERDNGIYDAMNKGIRMASGQLIGMINSDDCYEKAALEYMVDSMTKEPYQILYGMLRKFTGDMEKMIVMTKHENMREVMIPHPTSFVTKKIYQDFGMYDTTYRSSADYDFMLRMYQNPEVHFVPVYKMIASFWEGGMSSRFSSSMEVLRLRRKYEIISHKQYYLGILKLYLKNIFDKVK